MATRREVFHFVISAEQSGLRLDKALSLFSEVQTRSRAEYLIEHNLVLLNGKHAKPSQKVTLGDRVQIEIDHPEKLDKLAKYDFKLDIVYEDNDVIVVNKPAGLVVHPAAGHANDTLVNALMAHTENLSMKFGEERPGIVHRLDKDTSGLIVVAKNDRAHEHLTKQFQARSIHRIYFALVYGQLKNSSGKIQSYLARHPIDRKKFSSVRDEKKKIVVSQDLRYSELGKWAITNYKVLRTVGSSLSYVQLKLETGRTHQIRVHLSELGHPIVGDTLYGADKKNSNLGKNLKQQIASIPRFALHAAELGFVHPTSLEKMHFSQKWPEDILPLLVALNLEPIDGV